MLNLEMHYWLYQEQHKDRLREIQHLQLLKEAGLQGINWPHYQKALAWLGRQIEQWNLTLNKMLYHGKILTKGVKNHQVKYP
jgi:hypothetical protein